MTTIKNQVLSPEEEELLFESVEQYEEILYAEILKTEDAMFLFPENEEEKSHLKQLQVKFKVVQSLLQKISPSSIE